MSVLTSLSRLARSKQGKKFAQQAMRYAQSPEGKKKIADARRRLASRRTSKPH